jgi:hypothetical protein
MNLMKMKSNKTKTLAPMILIQKIQKTNAKKFAKPAEKSAD